MSMNTEKERIAIERLRAFEPKDEPYYLCYSGGKDSDVIRILAQLAGVKHEIHHNLTTVDAPETIRYIQSIPDVIIDKPRYPDGKQITMWNLIVKKGIPPTRIQRYCCSVLKENGGKHRKKITGVRWDESRNRRNNSGLVNIIGKPKAMQKYAEENSVDYETAKRGGLVLNMDNDASRRMTEFCYRTTTTLVNPIIDWTDDDVWTFLHHYGCKANPLYQCGKNRVGCIGCPMQGAKRMKAEFARYPKYKANYIRAFDRMIDERRRRGLSIGNWTSGENVMKWWLGEDPDQMTLFNQNDL